jgi:hypothetical protein
MPEELESQLAVRLSIVVRFLAIASIVMFCLPFVGIALGIAGLLASYRTGQWPKKRSIVGIVLNLPLTAFALYGLAT